MKRAIYMITTQFKASRATGRAKKWAISNHSKRSIDFYQISRQIKATAAIEKEADTQYRVQVLRTDILDCKYMVSALAMYAKSRGLTKQERHQTSMKYEIPGYSRDKTSAFKPIDLPHHPTRRMQDLNETPSSDGSFTLSLLE